MVSARFSLVCLWEEPWSCFEGTPIEWGRLDGVDPQEYTGVELTISRVGRAFMLVPAGIPVPRLGSRGEKWHPLATLLLE